MAGRKPPAAARASSTAPTSPHRDRAGRPDVPGGRGHRRGVPGLVRGGRTPRRRPDRAGQRAHPRRVPGRRGRGRHRHRHRQPGARRGRGARWPARGVDRTADRAAGAGVDATARRPGGVAPAGPGPTARRRGRRATPGGPRVGTHPAPARSPATLVQATTTNRQPATPAVAEAWERSAAISDLAAPSLRSTLVRRNHHIRL
jgi:hypothetical protein